MTKVWLAVFVMKEEKDSEVWVVPVGSRQVYFCSFERTVSSS